MPRLKITYEPTYQGHPIMTNKDKGEGCYENILKKIKGNLDRMTEDHSKVFFMRMDERFPDGYHPPKDNKAISLFDKKFKEKLKAQGLDPRTVWVREQSREKHQHYHHIVLLNGHKTQSIHNHIKLAQELWTETIGVDSAKNKGLINDCTKDRNGKPQENGVLLRKDSSDFQEKFNSCFRRSSYPAKISTKNINQEYRSVGGTNVNERKRKER